jgi:hypothetical protein
MTWIFSEAAPVGLVVIEVAAQVIATTESMLAVVWVEDED